jgi:hypothetical protein
MSAIDHAAVRVKRSDAEDAPGRRALPEEAPVSRPSLPGEALAALAFVVLWLPLTAIALAFEWRGSWATPDDAGPLLRDFLQYGSAISGPLPPQLVLVALALGAQRRGRLGCIASGGIGVVGLLIAFNGVMSATSDAHYAPQAAQTLAGLGLGAIGAAMTVLAVRRLVRAR